jgi:hypothetical protein
MNAKIQKIKSQACCYRNRRRLPEGPSLRGRSDSPHHATALNINQWGIGDCAKINSDTIFDRRWTPTKASISTTRLHHSVAVHCRVKHSFTSCPRGSTIA